MEYRSAFAMLGLGFIIIAGGVYYSGIGVWDVFSRVAPYLKTDIPVSLPSVFTVPQGFKVEVYVSDVPGARVLARDPVGSLVLSQPSEGKVVTLPDKKVILEDLDRPHGVVFVDDTLFVAEEGAVKSYSYDSVTKHATYQETLAVLPTDGGHFTRTLLLHPDGKTLLVSVGSSCNVCNEEDSRRATVLAVNLETKEVTVFARGLRNNVFMTTNPVDGSIWGTDMGRDLLGDDIPPDEINILEKGKNFGWPMCYGKNVHDTAYDKNTYIRTPCQEPFEVPSLIDIQAHSAPLGIVFIPEEGWPAEYRLDALVAYHGSWNRSSPSGYKIVRFDVNGGRTGSEVDFMTGFLAGDEVLGRPVDILAEPGGTLYISDDHAGAVYRVTLVDESTLE